MVKSQAYLLEFENLLQTETGLNYLAYISSHVARNVSCILPGNKNWFVGKVLMIFLSCAHRFLGLCVPLWSKLNLLIVYLWLYIMYVLYIYVYAYTDLW